MSDTFVGPKIEHEPGGDTITVKSGGTVAIASGGALTGTRIQRRQVSVAIASATALTTVVPDRAILTSELPLTVAKVLFSPEAAIAGHATSNVTLQILQVSGAAASSTATVASLAFTTSNAILLDVPKDITLTTEVAIASGVLKHHYTSASSGLNVPAGVVTIEYVVDAT